MEVQLDTLIKQIKEHGIAEGERTAQEVVSQAEAKATEIVELAHNEARRIVNNAQQEATTMIARGKDGIKQAERDLLLTLENKLEYMCTKYVAQITHQALDAPKLVEIIKVALAQWNFGTNDNIFLHLSPSDAKQITKDAISGAIQSEGPHIDIIVDENIQKGFRINKSGDGSYAFDFTAESIGHALSVFLTPNIQELLK